MKKLGYLVESMGWIRPYHLAMSEWDKFFIANIFAMPADQNIKYIIFMVMDAYNMGIDNLDVKFVIQWDIPLLFDLMIQRMGQAERKGWVSTFVLFTFKQIRLKDLDKIEKCNTGFLSLIAVKAQLSNNN